MGDMLAIVCGEIVIYRPALSFTLRTHYVPHACAQHPIKFVFEMLGVQRLLTRPIQILRAYRVFTIDYINYFHSGEIEGGDRHPITSVGYIFKIARITTKTW